MSSDMATQLPDLSNVVWHFVTDTRALCVAQHGHCGAIIWFLGSSGPIIPTLAYADEESLQRNGCRIFLLDAFVQQVIGEIVNRGVYGICQGNGA
jgi:adenylylsulfate kinase-like enzyme